MLIWSPGMTLDDVEEEVVKNAYHFFNRDEHKAAESLKISVIDFNAKMERAALKMQISHKEVEKNKEKEKEYRQLARGIPKDGVTVKDITDEIR